MSIGPGYDAGQVLEASFNDNLEAINVLNLGGNLVPDLYNEINLTYVSSGNGIGQIQTAIYKLQLIVVAILTLNYDESNRLTSVTRT